MSYTTPWVQGVQSSSSLGILPGMHYGCTDTCPHFLWSCWKYPRLSLSSVPDWTLWIDHLNLTHHITFFGDMWMIDFHQHTCPVQPLLEHNPFHESTACAGNSISSWLTSFMKAACSLQSLMLVWTYFSLSYCQNCFLPPHFFFWKKIKKKREFFLASPWVLVCKTREWWRKKNLRKVHSWKVVKKQHFL